mgnify:CR=1 FL=1
MAPLGHKGYSPTRNTQSLCGLIALLYMFLHLLLCYTSTLDNFRLLQCALLILDSKHVHKVISSGRMTPPMSSHDASDGSSTGSVISHQQCSTVFAKHEHKVLMRIFEHIAVLRLRLSESCQWASCRQHHFSVPGQSAISITWKNSFCLKFHPRPATLPVIL